MDGISASSSIVVSIFPSSATKSTSSTLSFFSFLTSWFSSVILLFPPFINFLSYKLYLLDSLFTGSLVNIGFHCYNVLLNLPIQEDTRYQEDLHQLLHNSE